jgi:hypothetical protein
MQSPGSKASLGLVQQPQRRGFAVVGCRWPGMFGGQSVVHADHRDPEGVSEAAVACVPARCRSHVEAAAVDIQIDPSSCRALGSENPHRHPPSSGFDGLLHSRRSGQGLRGRAPNPRCLQAFQGAGAAVRAQRGVEVSALLDVRRQLRVDQALQSNLHEAPRRRARVAARSSSSANSSDAPDRFANQRRLGL